MQTHTARSHATLTMMRRRSKSASGHLAILGGSATALATPFVDDRVDLESIAHLCERQVLHGSSAVLVCGSTGEGQSLSEFEHGSIVAAAVEASARRIPIIAGCGAASTAGAAALASSAAHNGADALLCSAPAYVKPTQDGIVAHIRAVRQASDLPIMLYDVPGRVGVRITDETVAHLFELGLIVALKDATGDLGRPPRLRVLCGRELIQMTGEDASVAGYLAMGGHGCVSVTANVAPSLCAALHCAWEGGDLAEMARIRELLAPLHDALFYESNPIPLKAALLALQLCNGELRLPLTQASRATRDKLARVLAGILPAEQALGVTARNIVQLPAPQRQQPQH